MKRFFKLILCAIVAAIMAISVGCSTQGGNGLSDSGSGNDSAVKDGGYTYVGEDDNSYSGSLSYTESEREITDSVANYAITEEVKENVSYGEDVIRLEASDTAVTITESGNYLLSGEYSGGVTVAKGSGKVHIFLENAFIYNASANALDIKGKNTVTVTAISGTENTIKTDGKNALSSNVDLTVNGSGKINIVSTAKNGVKADGIFTVTGVTLNITSVNHGISACAVIAEDCEITVLTENDGEAKDGIHAEMSDPDSADDIASYIWTAEDGFVILKNVVYSCNVEGDGIQADTFVYISGGTFDINTTAKFVSYNSANMTAYELEKDDFRYRLGNDGVYYKQASDSQVSSGSYAMIQSSKGIKVGEIDYEVEDEDGTVSGEVTDGNYYIIIESGEVIINSADDAIHANSGNVTINGGKFSITTLDDAVAADYLAKINGGEITVSYCYEGIEGSFVEINGGTINIGYSLDDGINAASDYKVTEYIEINGGNIYVNAYGDGIDSNGKITVNGGTIFVDGPSDNGNGSIDSETGIFVNGGYLVAVGSSAWVSEATPKTSSKQYSLVYAGSAIAAGTTLTLKDSSGKEIVAFKTAKSASSVVISAPEIKSGSTYTLYAGSNALTTFTVSSTVTSVGTNAGGNFRPPQGGYSPSQGGFAPSQGGGKL